MRLKPLAVVLLLAISTQAAQAQQSSTTGTSASEPLGSCTVTSPGGVTTCSNNVSSASCAANAQEMKAQPNWQADQPCP